MKYTIELRLRGEISSKSDIRDGAPLKYQMCATDVANVMSILFIRFVKYNL